MNMPVFPDAILTAVLGYGVVFFGLVLLMAVVILMGRAMAGKAPSKAAEGPSEAPLPPAQPPLAPGSAGEVKLYGVPHREAAMIMAIVADELGVPLNQLRFKSIREVK